MLYQEDNSLLSMPSSQVSTSLFDLPLEVQVNVAWMLGRDGASQLSRTCHCLHDMGKSDALWRKFYLCDWGQCTKIKNGEWYSSYHDRYEVRMIEVKAFNENPTVIPGLDLQASSLFYTEKYIIEFLKESKVSRVSRGIYLCLSDVRINGILAAYFNTFDFEGQTVLDALTKLVLYVQFPSHFSVITKFMLHFAERYFKCNEDSLFRTTDAVYVLAFGIIMLNTDMHNPAVKSKMTLAQYIQNSRGINDGHDLPEKMLQDIYGRLKEKPLVFNKESPANHYDSSLWSWVSDWISKLKR